MPALKDFLKVFLWSLAAWVATIVFYFVTLFVAGIATGGTHVQLSAVENVVFTLAVVQFVIACLAIALVFFITRRYFQLGMQILWTVIYAVIQAITTALLAITLLVMFNR